MHRLEVRRADGTADLGSAVSIAPGRVITNCHVVRNASHILLFQDGRRLPASRAVGDAWRDLCALEVPELRGDAPTVAAPESYGVGTAVTAVGYSQGRFATSQGAIKGLFSCACDGGRVIQTSAGFEPGASGGGLFDTTGRLLGSLTFKSVSGGEFHFAVPISWMEKLDRPLADAQQPFWEGDSGTGGHLLVAAPCARGATGPPCSTWRATGPARRRPTRRPGWPSVAPGRACVSRSRRRAPFSACSR